jgi:hypothetical protein
VLREFLLRKSERAIGDICGRNRRYPVITYIFSKNQRNLPLDLKPSKRKEKKRNKKLRYSQDPQTTAALFKKEREKQIQQQKEKGHGLGLGSGSDAVAKLLREC